MHVTRQEKRSLRSARRDLRRVIAGQRDLDIDGPALAAQVLSVLDAADVQRGDTVTLYESVPAEPPTAPTLAALAQRGIRVLLPITLADLDLDWFFADDPQRTAQGRGAIAQARVVLAPGLAVDTRGGRLGQGGGCYDRALLRCRPGAAVHVILHPGELLDVGLPTEPHDQRVDGVITAEGARLVG